MEIRTTEQFDTWFHKLRDRKAKAKISARLRQCEISDHITGDHHGIGGGISEMRFHFGPGYRIYYTIDNDVLVILLIGSSKDDQSRGITEARKLLALYRGE